MILFSYYVHPEQKQRLEALARQSEKPVAELVRQATERYLVGKGYASGCLEK